MSNYYVSRCCGEQVADGTRETMGFTEHCYLCQGCGYECEVTAMIDTPNGTPKPMKEWSKNEIVKLIDSIPTEVPECENNDYDRGRKDYKEELLKLIK